MPSTVLAIILDMGGGYLAARHIVNIWLAVLAAILVGVVSAVVHSFLVLTLGDHIIGPIGWGTFFLSITHEIMFHPIVAVVSLLISRRKMPPRDGFGTETSADGTKYSGEFKDGKRHGQGTYTFASGEGYVGEFKDGQPKHGKFTTVRVSGAVTYLRQVWGTIVYVAVVGLLLWFLWKLLHPLFQDRLLVEGGLPSVFQPDYPTPTHRAVGGVAVPLTEPVPEPAPEPLIIEKYDPEVMEAEKEFR